MDFISLITGFGYLGITAAVFAETGLFVGFFLPGDSLLFTAGFLAWQGFFNIEILVVLCTIAGVLGNSVGYACGHHYGPKIFKRENSLFFHRDHLERARSFYERHGVKTIILARFVPIVRTFAPILAGVGLMHYSKFLIYNIVGCFLWAAGVPLLGYYLGYAIPNIDHYIVPIVLAIILISISPGIVHILWSADDRRRLALIIAAVFRRLTRRI